MNIVLDTNVLLSGLFFGGRPLMIVEACLDGRLGLVVSPEILSEYEEAGLELAEKHSMPAFGAVLKLLADRAVIIRPAPLEQQVCRDPKDDMFLACALGGKARCIVSGDNDLHAIAPHPEFSILRPKQFIDQYLKDRVELDE